MFALDVSLMASVFVMISLRIDRFSNSITFLSSFSTSMSFVKFECPSLKWARFGMIADLDIVTYIRVPVLV